VKNHLAYFDLRSNSAIFSAENPDPRSFQEFIAQRGRDFDRLEHANGSTLKKCVQGGMHDCLHVAITTYWDQQTRGRVRGWLDAGVGFRQERHDDLNIVTTAYRGNGT
jgi:hypothetical protein